MLVKKSLAALDAAACSASWWPAAWAPTARLREQLDAACAKRGVRVHYPELALCTDNGAMIALAAAMRLQAGVQQARRPTPSTSSRAGRWTRSRPLEHRRVSRRVAAGGVPKMRHERPHGHRPPSSDPAGTWNRRFSESGYLFGTEPNGWLREHADLWEAGQRVLCVADGEGRNSVWLAQRG